MLDSNSEAVERTRLMDYKVVFGSEAGQRVLRDLEERFLYQDSRAHVSAGNTSGVLWIDGQRNLVASIKKWSERPVEVNMPKLLQPIQPGDPLHG